MIKEIFNASGGCYDVGILKRLGAYRDICIMLGDDLDLGDVNDITKYCQKLVSDFMYGKRRLIDTNDGLLKGISIYLEDPNWGYDVQDYFIAELQEKLLCNINTRFDRYNAIQMDRDFMYYVSKFELRYNIDSDIWRYTINKDIDSICSLVISMKSGNSIFEFRRWGDKILKLCLKPNTKLMGVSPCRTALIIGNLDDEVEAVLSVKTNKPEVDILSMSESELRKRLVLGGVLY